MIRTALCVSLALIAIPACGKKKEGADDKAGSTADKPVEGAPAKLAFKKLGSLPVEAEVPDDANIEDSTKSAGFPSVTVYASPTTFISGAGDMSDVKPTIEETKTRAAKDLNGFKSWTKEEKTADGWILEGEGTAMGETTPLYKVSVRRTINNAPYDCGTNDRSKDGIAKAEKLCQSLRAAK